MSIYNDQGTEKLNEITAFPTISAYKGFSFIVCLTIVTLILIATVRPHTAGLHQATVSA